MRKLSKEFVELCRSVTAKRPRTVIDHILEHGHITTEELKEKYGYNHPPRAARDVREYGIPLETFTVSGSDGRKIAAYRFGDTVKKRFRKLSSRTGLSKKLKDELIVQYGCRCFIYLEYVDASELQIGHRIPSTGPIQKITRILLAARYGGLTSSGKAKKSKSTND